MTTRTTFDGNHYRFGTIEEAFNVFYDTSANVLIIQSELAIGSRIDLLSISSTEIVLNEDGVDRDFRVEGDNETSLIVTDGANDLVGIGGAVTSGVQLTITDDTNATANEVIRIIGANSVRADQDELTLSVFMANDGGTSTQIVGMNFGINDVSAGSEDGQYQVRVTQGGTLRNLIQAGFAAAGNGEVIINQDSVDCDFRVEGDNNANVLFVDASADMVKVGAATAHASTAGTLGISLFEGTAPSGSLANGATLFADVVSSDEVLRGIDSAGNVTTI